MRAAGAPATRYCASHLSLTGAKPLPSVLPGFVGIGDEDEAVAYVSDANAAWDAAAGAKEWLREALKPALAPLFETARGRGAVATESDRIDDAVLALLYLGLHDGERTWKGFDWEAMDRLHARGLITDPQGKAKSVAFTEEGLKASRQMYEKLFALGKPTP